jgi:hypothetical protein
VQNSAITALKSYIHALDFSEENSPAYRAKSAFEMLLHVDDMTRTYETLTKINHEGVLLNVFGVLQALFVGIDALYDLSIGLTHFKYHINVNQNKTLRQLKFIRNDVVGHPTHRTYHEGAVGFSMIDVPQTTMKILVYDTYYYQKNKVQIKHQKVEMMPIIHAYHLEKEHLLQSLVTFLSQTPKHSKLDEKVYTLYETLQADLVKEVVTQFQLDYQIQDPQHRFLWRASLLEHAIKWQSEDQDLQALITYIAKYQASKMYHILEDLNGNKGKDLYTELPEIVVELYRFMRHHESKIVPRLKVFQDPSHEMLDTYLDMMIGWHPNVIVRKFFNYFQHHQNETSRYLLGSIFTQYRPKT